MKKRITSSDNVFTFTFFALISFLLFYAINARTFHLWDEARLGMNAANMFINQNYFYTVYDGAPDFWNTKPHLLILLQVLSIKLFGFSEGSVRLPSAIAVLCSSILIFHWLKKETYPPLYAALAVLGFLCTGFLMRHGAKTADYEAVLILWEISYAYAFYCYSNTQYPFYLIIGFATLTFAVLTKGIAGLLLTPGLFLFMCIQNKLPLFLKSKLFYFSTCCCVACIIFYYYLHEQLTPGYLNAVNMNEISGRYLNVNEGHSGEMGYYFHLFSLRFFYFLPVWLIGLVYLIVNLDLLKKNTLLQYVLILMISFFIIISSAHTKLEWYAYPIYPFLGISLAILSKACINHLHPKQASIARYLLVTWMILAYLTAVTAMLVSMREKPNLGLFVKRELIKCRPNDYLLMVNHPSQYDASLDFEIIRYFALTQHRLKKIALNAKMNKGDWIVMDNREVSKINLAIKPFPCSKDPYFKIYQVR